MYDALIIGSGIGSLTTAGLLAQTAGLRVLVLEKHSTPGGLTHSFRAMGASWDVGLHYVGDMEPGSRPRQLLDYLTGGALSWTRMPTGYDRFYLPGHGLDVTIPSSLQEYRCLLTSLFPREKRAIRRYCVARVCPGDGSPARSPRRSPHPASARRLRARADGTLHGAPIPRPRPARPPHHALG